MTNYIPKFRTRDVFPVISLTLGLFLLSQNVLLAADDFAIAGLQQDIIHAKQKQEGFAQKASSVKDVFEVEHSQLLRQQAEDLISSLTKDGYKSIELKPSTYTAGPSPKKDLSPSSSGRSLFELALAPEKEDERLKKIEPRKPWIFAPFPKLFGEKKTRYEDRIAESEALYKVAISDGKISLKEAEEISLSNSVQLRALKKKVEVAESKWMEAKRALYPTIQFQVDENGGLAPSGQRFYKGRAYKINATQPLYYGGELVLTSKQAEEGVKQAEAEYDKTRNELIQLVRVGYYSVVKAEYNAQYQADLLKDVDAFYRSMRTAHSQKLISEIDYLNIESQYQQVVFTADAAQNDLMTAHLTLKQDLNLDVATELPVDLKLDFKRISPDFAVLLNLALEKNPDIRMKQLQYLSAKDGVAIYYAKKRPRLDLRGSYGLLGEVFKDSQAIEEDNHDLDLEKEWYVGIKGSMPIGANSIEYDQVKHVYGPTVSAFQGSEDWRKTGKFNLLDRFSDITDTKSAEATLLQAEADWQKSKTDLIAKMKEDYYNIQKSMIQMDSAVAKIRYQDKQNAILKYTLSMLESEPGNYLEGMIEQSSNRFAFIQAVADYNTAVSGLGVSVGDPTYFEGKNES